MEDHTVQENRLIVSTRTSGARYSSVPLMAQACFERRNVMLATPL